MEKLFGMSKWIWRLDWWDDLDGLLIRQEVEVPTTIKNGPAQEQRARELAGAPPWATAILVGFKPIGEAEISLSNKDDVQDWLTIQQLKDAAIEFRWEEMRPKIRAHINRNRSTPAYI